MEYLVPGRQFDQLGDAVALAMPRCLVVTASVPTRLELRLATKVRLSAMLVYTTRKYPRGIDTVVMMATARPMVPTSVRSVSGGMATVPQSGHDASIAQDALDPWRSRERQEAKGRHDTGRT